MFPTHTIPLGPILGADRILSFDATSDGRILLLTITRETAEEQGVARDPRGERWYFNQGLRKPYDATLIIVDKSNARRLTLRGLAAFFPRSQLLPRDEILVVNARCDDRNEKDGAFVYDPDGRLRRSFALGDGIEHVQALTDGSIWVGYFDEGIFGNTGWKSKPWVREAATSGLACFDAQGDLVWRYRRPPDCEHIADCYALNATDAGIWACTYTSYPVIKIQSDGSVRYWHNSIPGIQALVVAGSELLLWDGGALPEDEVRATIQRIDGDELTDLRDISLTLPDGSLLDGRTATVLGRGSQLHALAGTEWHCFDFARRESD